MESREDVVSFKAKLETRSEDGIQAREDVDPAERALARISAIGSRYSSLVSNSGRKFDEVKITKVTDVGVHLKHQSGTARIRFDDLPNSWQERFFYDPQMAEQTLALERAMAARAERRASILLAEQAARGLAEKERHLKLNHDLALAEASRPIEITEVTKQITQVVCSCCSTSCSCP